VPVFVLDFAVSFGAVEVDAADGAVDVDVPDAPLDVPVGAVEVDATDVVPFAAVSSTFAPSSLDLVPVFVLDFAVYVGAVEVDAADGAVNPDVPAIFDEPWRGSLGVAFFGVCGFDFRGWYGWNQVKY